MAMPANTHKNTTLNNDRRQRIQCPLRVNNLSPNFKKEWQYFLVPIKKCKRETLIRDIEINNQKYIKNDILGKLSYYKSIEAPNYKIVRDIVSDIEFTKYKRLIELNVDCIKAICNYLDVKTEIEISSANNYDFSNIENKDDWALEISKSENASIYINPIGGSYLFDKSKYLRNHINLKFLKGGEINYKQSNRKFIPSLSILDIMMFNPKEKIKDMLNEYELI